MKMKCPECDNIESFEEIEEIINGKEGKTYICSLCEHEWFKENLPTEQEMGEELMQREKKEAGGLKAQEKRIKFCEQDDSTSCPDCPDYWVCPDNRCFEEEKEKEEGGGGKK